MSNLLLIQVEIDAYYDCVEGCSDCRPKRTHDDDSSDDTDNTVDFSTMSDQHKMEIFNQLYWALSDDNLQVFPEGDPFSYIVLLPLIQQKPLLVEMLLDAWKTDTVFGLEKETKLVASVQQWFDDIFEPKHRDTATATLLDFCDETNVCIHLSINVLSAKRLHLKNIQ